MKDIPRVMEIELQSFATPWSESAYITEMHNQSAFYIVAKLHGKVVGYAGMWVIMDEAHITTIAVDPEFRGRKLGERLVVALLDEGLARGVRHATLEVRRSNVPAQRLYEKYGFATVAVRRAYYANNHEDALVMWLRDMNSPQYLCKYRELKQRLAKLAEDESSAAAGCEAAS